MKLNFDDNFESSARYLDEYFIFFCCSPEQVRQKENIDFSRKNNRPHRRERKKSLNEIKKFRIQGNVIEQVRPVSATLKMMFLRSNKRRIAMFAELGFANVKVLD